MGRFFVDRIEDGIVFCEEENGNEIRFKKFDINGNPKEGDVIFEDSTGNRYVDAEATAERRKEIMELRKYIYKTKSEKTI